MLTVAAWTLSHTVHNDAYWLCIFWIIQRMYDAKLSSSIVSSKSASSMKKSVFNENGSNMHLGMTHKCFIYQGGVCIILKVNVKCLLFPSQHKKSFFSWRSTNLSSMINIHQGIKLESRSLNMWQCVFCFRRQPFLCASILHVCACTQRAPFGMNYLQESLFCLCTVQRPRAHKVPLLSSQETSLIYHSSCCLLPCVSYSSTADVAFHIWPCLCILSPIKNKVKRENWRRRTEMKP